jgi:Na+/proline symporter
VAAAAFDGLSTVLTVGVLGFMAVRLMTGVRVARSRSGRALVTAIRRRIGWRHVWPVPIVLTIVIIVASLLMLVPGLDWGWWSALGGEGNPVFGSTDSTSGTAWEWLIPLVFVALLLPALPLFAHAEERIFRSGAEHWSRQRRVFKTVQFGLVHALIGIPIGAAIALSIGGGYFMRVYLREFARTHSSEQATLESATAHSVYNGVISGIVILAVVLAPLIDWIG